MEKAPFDARNTMLSPPEQTPQDSFSPSIAARSMGSAKHIVKQNNALAPLSPPVSPPADIVNPSLSPNERLSTGPDPILFPQDSTSPSQRPLFDHDERLVNEHVQARDSTAFRDVAPPQRDDYKLVLEFKSQVAHAYNTNRKAWREREFAQLREDAALRNGGRRYTVIAPASGGRNAKASRPVKESRVVKAPRVRAPAANRGATPDMAKRVAREDKDYSSLPDFCPPLSSLPDKVHSLKVDWKGAPIDLKSDPHAHLLHPDEIHLAANLRLDCATYLTSKRRIFMQRIECYKINKEFRKTDAQQACKIDVNKASKLWSAFDKVGWLNQKYIAKFV